MMMIFAENHWEPSEHSNHFCWIEHILIFWCFGMILFVRWWILVETWYEFEEFVVVIDSGGGGLSLLRWFFDSSVVAWVGYGGDLGERNSVSFLVMCHWVIHPSDTCDELACIYRPTVWPLNHLGPATCSWTCLDWNLDYGLICKLLKLKDWTVMQFLRLKEKKNETKKGLICKMRN
jgi:hypothetical protein